MSKSLKAKRTTTILAELVRRIAHQCSAAGRDDLIEGLHLLESMVRAGDAAGLRRNRRTFLEILRADDSLVEAGGMIADLHDQWAEAEIEQLSATIQ